MSLKDRNASAATDHHHKVETVSPSVLDLSLNVLEGRNASAATDHHRKVETFSPLVLDLSINLFEGLPSVCSNRSSSQSRNISFFFS